MIVEYPKESQLKMKLKADSSLYIAPSSEIAEETRNKFEIQYLLHFPKMPPTY